MALYAVRWQRLSRTAKEVKMHWGNRVRQWFDSLRVINVKIARGQIKFFFGPRFELTGNSFFNLIKEVGFEEFIWEVRLARAFTINTGRGDMERTVAVFDIVDGPVPFYPYLYTDEHLAKLRVLWNADDGQEQTHTFQVFQG